MQLIEETESSFKVRLHSKLSFFIKEFQQNIISSSFTTRNIYDASNKYIGTIDNTEIKLSKIIYYYTLPFLISADGKLRLENNAQYLSVSLTSKREMHGCWIVLALVLILVLAVVYALQYHLRGLSGLYTTLPIPIFSVLFFYYVNKLGSQKALIQFKADLIKEIELIEQKLKQRD